jgi:hypothetical protein
MRGKERQEMLRSTTQNQEFFYEDGRLRATIDVEITQERDAPSIKACRHAVLTIVTRDNKGDEIHAHVIYDRLLCRIINGVFDEDLVGTLRVAHLYNIDPNSGQDMNPNGLALGLHYPVVEGEEHRYEIQ